MTWLELIDWKSHNSLTDSFVLYVLLTGDQQRWIKKTKQLFRYMTNMTAKVIEYRLKYTKMCLIYDEGREKKVKKTDTDVRVNITLEFYSKV